MENNVVNQHIQEKSSSKADFSEHPLARKEIGSNSAAPPPFQLKDSSVPPIQRTIKKSNAEDAEEYDGDEPAWLTEEKSEVYWELVYEDAVNLVIPEDASAAEATAILEQGKEQLAAIEAGKKAEEDAAEKALIKGETAKAAADELAEASGGINIVGTGYSEYLASQDHINWAKVLEKVEELQENPNLKFTIEVCGKTLSECHHRFVATKLLNRDFDTKEVAGATGEDWSITQWTGFSRETDSVLY